MHQCQPQSDPSSVRYGYAGRNVKLNELCHPDMESLFLAGPHFMCSIFASCLLIPSLTIPGLYYSTPKYFLIYMSVSTPRGNLLLPQLSGFYPIAFNQHLTTSYPFTSYELYHPRRTNSPFSDLGER
jgi:hypothetical protein